MAIATSGDRENAEAALDRLGVLSYFEGICTCSETGWGKSRPDVYFAAERLLHTNPKETWIFEDALHALRTAKRAGFLRGTACVSSGRPGAPLSVAIEKNAEEVKKKGC